MKLITLFFVLASSSLFAADKTPPIPVAPKIDDPRSVTVSERSVVAINVCQLQNTILVLP